MCEQLLPALGPGAARRAFTSLLCVCDSELFPWPPAPQRITASAASALAPAVDLQRSNPSGFVLVSCDSLA